MEFKLEFKNKYKKKSNYSIDPDLLDKFNALCKHKNWKKSQVIERLMEKLIEQESNILTCSK